MRIVILGVGFGFLAAAASVAADEKWKAKPLPPAIKKQWISLVKDHKTSDGATVMQVLRYAEKLRPGKFKVGAIDIGYSGGSGEPEGVSIDYFIGAKRLDGDSFSAFFTIEKSGGAYRIVFAPDHAPGVKRAEQTIEEGREALIRMIDEDYRENCIDPETHAKLC